MMRVVPTLLWIGCVGCGCMAGVYFAFSTFVMPALGRVAPPVGIATMNSINEVILVSAFMPLFWATTLASLALAAISFSQWHHPGAWAMAAAGLIYVIGMFGCTVFFNVPLNDALAAADPASADSATLWARYLHEWTLWNHVRTVASLVATILFIISLRART